MSQASFANKAEYQRIGNWLQERCGMVFPEKKSELLINRMQSVCDRHKIPDLNTLADRLEMGVDSDLHYAVIHAASTNHTYFFREPQVLNFFQDHILANLPAEGARIWSAAASSGDEAYTLAIIAAEKRGMKWAKHRLAILGTDISGVVIAEAEKAVYGAIHIDKMPATILPNYFDEVGSDQYQLKAEIRQLCTFRRLNLKNHPYPFQRNFHVVFCRNVLYYFDKPQQKQIIEAIYDVTEPGGWLLTSVTVSLRGLESRWQMIDNGIYRKPF
jgi:chemotaxis protein methyltransferase CheR